MLELRSVILSDSVVLGWRKAIKDKIEEIREQYSREGWDGSDALPISYTSAMWAKRVIDWLPSSAASPEIVPEPNGDVALEWSKDSNLLLSMSVAGRTLIYAGLLGTEKKIHGEEVLVDELPATIVGLLQDYFCKV